MLQLLANGICHGATYALVALGFSLIYATTGVLHIAHGATYVVSAYALFSCLVLLSLPLPVALVCTLALAASLGVFMEKVVYRPLAARKASPTVVLISSLGIYIIVVNLIAVFYGAQSRVVKSGVEATRSFAGIILTDVQLAQLVVSVFVFLVYALFLSKSSLGRVSKAVADDPALAAVLGVPVGLVRSAVLGAGSVLAAIASSLMLLDVGTDPFVGFPVFVFAFVACIIGGARRFLAPAAGALILAVLQSVVVWKTSDAWESAVTYGILLLLLLFRPAGVLDVTRRVEER